MVAELRDERKKELQTTQNTMDTLITSSVTQLAAKVDGVQEQINEHAEDIGALQNRMANLETKLGAAKDKQANTEKQVEKVMEEMAMASWAAPPPPARAGGF